MKRFVKSYEKKGMRLDKTTAYMKERLEKGSNFESLILVDPSFARRTDRFLAHLLGNIEEYLDDEDLISMVLVGPGLIHAYGSCLKERRAFDTLADTILRDVDFPIRLDAYTESPSSIMGYLSPKNLIPWDSMHHIDHESHRDPDRAPKSGPGVFNPDIDVITLAENRSIMITCHFHQLSKVVQRLKYFIRRPEDDLRLFTPRFSFAPIYEFKREDIPETLTKSDLQLTRSDLGLNQQKMRSLCDLCEEWEKLGGPFRLTDLPTELRLEVLKYALKPTIEASRNFTDSLVFSGAFRAFSSWGNPWGTGSNPSERGSIAPWALLSVSKQVRRETGEVFLNNATVVTFGQGRDSFPRCLPGLKRFDPTFLRALRNIELGWSSPTGEKDHNLEAAKAICSIPGLRNLTLAGWWSKLSLYEGVQLASAPAIQELMRNCHALKSVDVTNRRDVFQFLNGRNGDYTRVYLRDHLRERLVPSCELYKLWPEKRAKLLKTFSGNQVLVHTKQGNDQVLMAMRTLGYRLELADESLEKVRSHCRQAVEIMDEKCVVVRRLLQM